MCEIEYNRAKHIVTVKGHTMTAEAGKDLVCAAVTMLTHTLAADCVVAEDEKVMKDLVIKLEPGDAEIACAAMPRCNSVVMCIFDSIVRGFEILSKKYPDCVTLTIS